MTAKGEPSAKAEALRAIGHAIERLTNPDALAGLNRKLLVTTLEHAREQVAAIQEIKRPRRAVTATNERKVDAHG